MVHKTKIFNGHIHVIFISATCLSCHSTHISRPALSYFTYFTAHDIYLTRWGRMTHICVSKLTVIGSPDWCQAIIWTNTRILLIWPLGTNFSEILIKIQTFSFKKVHLKMSSGQWWPFLSQPQCVQHKKVCYPFHGSLTFGCARVQQYQQIML